jgi:hypothetical protein
MQAVGVQDWVHLRRVHHPVYPALALNDARRGKGPRELNPHIVVGRSDDVPIHIAGLNLDCFDVQATGKELLSCAHVPS